MPRVRFDPNLHTYTLDGKILPSVTQVLKNAGVIKTFGMSEWHRNRGTQIHKALELADRDDLDEASLDERVLPFVLAYRLFLHESGAEVMEVEKRVWSKLFQYAGTLDRVFKLNSKNVIVDLKTGSDPPWSGMQLSAYEQAAKEMGLKTFGNYVLELKPNGKYRLINKADRLAEFLHHLQEVKHAANHGNR